FVLDKLATAVDQEMNDDTRLRERLLEAQMRHELGEISAGELAATEKDILARLRVIQEERSGGSVGPISFESGVSVETEVGGDEGMREEPPPPEPKKKRKK